VSKEDWGNIPNDTYVRYKNMSGVINKGGFLIAHVNTKSGEPALRLASSLYGGGGMWMVRHVLIQTLWKKLATGEKGKSYAEPSDTYNTEIYSENTSNVHENTSNVHGNISNVHENNDIQKIYNDMSKLELNIDSMKNNINKLEADMKYVVEFLLKKHGNAAAVPIETSHAPYR